MAKRMLIERMTESQRHHDPKDRSRGKLEYIVRKTVGLPSLTPGVGDLLSDTEVQKLIDDGVEMSVQEAKKRR